jgi:hypothetical protein
MSDEASQSLKEIRLRYAARCRACARELPIGSLAVHDRETKSVSCLACVTETSTANSGVAGASALREYARRKQRRETRIREDHPLVGGLLLAISDDPQSTKAWATGAQGEERLGQHLDKLAGDRVHLLHDRRIPGSRANIDHIVVSSSGVFVIDAKKYKDRRPSLRVEGGLFRRADGRYRCADDATHPSNTGPRFPLGLIWGCVKAEDGSSQVRIRIGHTDA